MEVPSPQAGEVLELLVKVGDKVKTGAEVLRLSAAAGSEVGPAQERLTKVSRPLIKLLMIWSRFKHQSLLRSLYLLRRIPQARLIRLRFMLGQRSKAGASWVLTWNWCMDLARGRVVKEDIHAFVKTRIMVLQLGRRWLHLQCPMLISLNSARLRSGLALNCRKLPLNSGRLEHCSSACCAI